LSCSFLLLAQKKRTKEKGTTQTNFRLAIYPRASLSRPCNLKFALRRGGAWTPHRTTFELYNIRGGGLIELRFIHNADISGA
jgi:hypothetical protein